MNMMRHQAIKECFNIELVCTVKWREMEFLGDKFLPSSVSVKAARNEVSEINL